MLYELKILKKGDKVLNLWDGKIAISRANGDVDVYELIFEKGQLPRLSEDVWRVTYGENEIIEITGGCLKQTEEDEDDDDFVISIKSPGTGG